ncbi:nitroreductase family protein [candidate division KSB1 bacterium]|nr:nitroreductase family protein [candidate division KSB1 bacterium]
MNNSLFSDLVHQRRSIRRYADKPVELDKIRACIEAARVAPSAENVEPWRFIVLNDPAIKQPFCDAAFSGVYKFTQWASKAPVIIVVLAKLDILANRIGKQIQGTNYYLIDIGIAGEHFVLQAAELGLGTCWIGWFNSKKARKFLKIPASYKVVSLISMGYPDRQPQNEKKRLQLNDILWMNGFQK